VSPPAFDLPSFRVSAQRSGFCRYAYGPAYGFPTHNLEEAKADARRMSRTLNENVKLLDDAYRVVDHLTPSNDTVSKAKP
jgi:ABC-type sulfate transport system substrate-binding protein